MSAAWATPSPGASHRGHSGEGVAAGVARAQPSQQTSARSARAPWHSRAPSSVSAAAAEVGRRVQDRYATHVVSRARWPARVERWPRRVIRVAHREQ
jgi:hypothetical protein